MEAFAHVQSDRLRIQTELLKCSNGDTSYHFYLLCISPTQGFIMTAILAGAEYLPTSSKTNSANDPHLNFPLPSLPGDDGTHFGG